MATIVPTGSGETTSYWSTSTDGTRIGVTASGSGPPLVVVHGATADHTRWGPVLGLLEPHVTVHAIDRRGRGTSGDGAGYAVEREYEDVAAVLADVADSTGGPVDLLGHSYGGLCALGGAMHSPHVGRLVLYEPPVLPEASILPDDLLERLERLLAEDRRDEMLTTFFREAVFMPEAELARFRALPAWSARVAAAHTLARELQVARDGDWFDPERVARLDVPTLLLLGGDSPDIVQQGMRTLFELLPDARLVVLEGQQHVAIDTASELFVEHVLAFLREPRGAT